MTPPAGSRRAHGDDLRPLGLIFGHDALGPADSSTGNRKRHVSNNVPGPDAENFIGNGELRRLPDKGADRLVPFGHRLLLRPPEQSVVCARNNFCRTIFAKPVELALAGLTEGSGRVERPEPEART